MADSYPFLSDEWMDAAKAIRAEYADRLDPPSTPIRMNNIITNVPFGDGVVHAHLDTSEGRIVLDHGHLDEVDVTVETDYDTARALFVDQDPQVGMQAFMNGKIKVTGDISRVMVMQSQQIDPIAREIAEKVRSITEG
ncbi:MAG: SCP2 sterol-binding domain-containing protein [Actinomycetota bacterium]|nr:SCP2 sterol-binding domain-containing protein [Actinomycetota bacterium]